MSTISFLYCAIHITGFSVSVCAIQYFFIAVCAYHCMQTLLHGSRYTQALARIVLADACAIDFSYSVITGGANNPKKRKFEKLAEDDELDPNI